MQLNSDFCIKVKKFFLNVSQTNQAGSEDAQLQ